MNDKQKAVLAWLLLALSIAFFGALLALESTECQFLYDPSQSGPAFAYGIFLVPVSALAFSLLGTLVIAYRPQNRFGWVMLLIGIGFNLLMLLNSYSNCAVLGEEALAFGPELFWLAEILGALVFSMSFVLLFMLFPNGRFLSPRWRRLTMIITAFLLIMTFVRAFSPGPIRQTLGEIIVENPLGQQSFDLAGLSGMTELASLTIPMLFIMAGIISLVIRWQRAAGEMRQQIKWIAYFVAMAGFLFIIVELIGPTIYPPIFDGWFYFFVLLIFWIGLPLVIGLAVLKYRLYDIDIIIRRTLLYTLLTVLLIAVYFGVVLVAQSLFVALTGQESPLAIVISTLIIAALFNPLRRWVQSFIDRRFFRQQYDRQQVLPQFSQSARDEVQIESLTADLQRIMQETMQPESLSIWLKATSFKRGVGD